MKIHQLEVQTYLFISNRVRPFGHMRLQIDTCISVIIYETRGTLQPKKVSQQHKNKFIG